MIAAELYKDVVSTVFVLLIKFLACKVKTHTIYIWFKDKIFAILLKPSSMLINLQSTL